MFAKLVTEGNFLVNYLSEIYSSLMLDFINRKKKASMPM